MTDSQTGRVLNPADVEVAIREAANTVAEGVNIVTVRLDEYRQAEAAYDLAYAMAFMQHPGPQTEKRYAAEIATATERKARDTAEVAYKYADRRCRAAESTLSAYQTISKSVTAMYGAAGRGDY